MPWYTTKTPSQEPESLLVPGFKLVKLHGSVDDPSSCILTLSSYVRAYTVNLRWYLADVFSTNTVICLGTSMNPAEPFFRTLRLLKALGRFRQKRRFAILAVRDKEAGKVQGKRLDDDGIEVIPYVPDQTHQFIDDLLSRLDQSLVNSKACTSRVQHANRLTREGRAIDAAVHLWHLCRAEHSERYSLAIRRQIGDSVSNLCEKVMSDSRAAKLLQDSAERGVPLMELLGRVSDVALPGTKAIGWILRSLNAFESIVHATTPGLREKLESMAII